MQTAIGNEYLSYGPVPGILVSLLLVPDGCERIHIDDIRKRRTYAVQSHKQVLYNDVDGRRFSSGPLSLAAKILN